VNLRPYMTAPASAVLAMIYHHQGHPDWAKRELENVRAQIGPKWPGVHSWHERSLAQALLQEAEKLIAGAPPGTAKK